METASKPTSGDPEALQHIILGLQKKIADKDAKITQLEQNYQYLLEQFRLAQQRQFGKSSETAPNQLGLFNESEDTQEETKAQETEQETIHYQRNKPKRKPLPKDLPRETVVHDIDDADKVCDCCGGDLHKMGEDVLKDTHNFIRHNLPLIGIFMPVFNGCLKFRCYLYVGLL